MPIIISQNRQQIKFGNKEYFELIMGQSPKSETYNIVGDGLPFFQGKKEFGEISPIPVQYCSKPIRVAKSGDILLSVRAPVGPTNLADQQCCIGRGLGAIRCKENKVEIGYLQFFFKKFEVEMSQMGKGSTFNAITKGDLENLQIPLPPLETQKAIVAKLDEIFANLDQTKAEIQKNIDAVDEVWKSSLNKVFEEGEWEKIQFKNKDYFELIMGQSPKSETYNTNGDGLPFFQGKKEFGETSPIPVQYCNKPIRIAESGDILLSVRAPVGPTNLADQKCCIGRGLGAIRCKENKIEFLYLKFFFKKFESEISQMGKGSTFSAITKGDLENLQIPLPPLPKQKEIVAHLDQLSNETKQLRSKYQSQLDHIEELRKSVLDQAFKGELI